ncbi:TonB family protein [Rhodoplanes sp. TEM]|uniref:TonB family protein n=1 Tax=Rhodoplanes tepidamans TaxID=200616 RepID=A0ABT5JD90_RHOTP|nr:TonB family protein [Rhodoplanes tepidamans]MDC7787010.1 TonB family protein [Rhodoplanes tepidamans]MDC7987018.1 TonB family protein [Rhodoplanes sp. TEM]MDQ0354265.1 TonB family protein [Rhodoplanes tepidamans]
MFGGRGRPAVAAIVALSLGLTPAVASDAGSRIGPELSFDIPAQDLDRALDAFGAATGVQILYETALVANRRSGAVAGVLDRDAALRRLLAGSGLVPRVIATGTIAIAPSREAVTDPGLLRAKQAAHVYYGHAQSGLVAALCRDAATRQPGYRVVLQYWLDPAGRIVRLRVIGSSGDDARDRAVARVVTAARFDPPPAGMPQPVTVAVEPGRGGAAGCRSEASLVR